MKYLIFLLSCLTSLAITVAPECPQTPSVSYTTMIYAAGSPFVGAPVAGVCPGCGPWSGYSGMLSMSFIYPTNCSGSNTVVTITNSVDNITGMIGTVSGEMVDVRYDDLSYYATNDWLAYIALFYGVATNNCNSPFGPIAYSPGAYVPGNSNYVGGLSTITFGLIPGCPVGPYVANFQWLAFYELDEDPPLPITQQPTIQNASDISVSLSGLAPNLPVNVWLTPTVDNPQWGIQTKRLTGLDGNFNYVLPTNGFWTLLPTGFNPP